MKNKVLKKIIIVLIILFIGFVTLIKVNFLDYERPKKYNEIDEITFANFRGLEFFQKTLYGNKHFAYIKTTIDFEIENDSIRIESFFHPSSSFVYNKNVYSKDLLTHELYHFKITELYTRIAKKRISELQNPSKQKIKEIINNIKIEEQNYQYKYDDDTFHSYVLGEQKKYEKTIDSLLNLYNSFKNPKIKINEN